MKELIAVFIGSGPGGVSRFGLGKWVNSWHNHHFPFGSFVVNVVACFVLGFIIGLADHKQILSPTARLFSQLGFVAGSTPLVLFIPGSVLLCVTATFGGLFIADRI